VVRHVRVAGKGDVDQREGRHGQDAVPRGRQRPPADAPAKTPQHHHHRQHRQRVEVLPPDRRVDRPPRIDEHQVRRPHQLARVEPQRPARDQSAIEPRLAEPLATRPPVVRLQVHRHHDERRPHRHQGGQRQKVTADDPATLPPHHQQQRRRQEARRRLTQQRADKERHPQHVRHPPAGRSRTRHPQVPHEQQHRRQEERRRQDVLQFAHPRHRLHVHGVHREHRRRQPRRRQSQHTQQTPQQHRVERVQQDVDQVVADGVLPPQPVLEPEGRRGQRVVLVAVLGPGDLRPDPAQARQRLHPAVVGHVHAVVDHEPRVQRRQVRHQRQQDQAAYAQHGTFAKPPRQTAADP
jgi:hypothetical protein